MPESAAADTFDELADDYDADGSHEQLARKLVVLAATGFNGWHPRAVLDVGTGTGAAARSALATFPAAWVTAVDISPAMIDRARALTGQDTGRNRIRWLCAPAIPFPAPDGSADLVLCASTLHFLGISAFDDWQRVLRPGGLAAFTLPWRSRFRPGPSFAALLPAPDQQLPLPVSEPDAAARRWPGFELLATAAADKAAAFLLRRK
ncbi:class I SAM-dependent methyltransferase [Microlunatus sp. Gsoil 973]|uniref:class I SAM-dependent methyltransferase n=1 Tax=Microlunatus sp. Gsoil 973 TaxID=2672569 RepID=UPI0018A85178|nr:class I SAM-dependent methyltransferase [Microlunatus sp. Gsoil 973]